MKNVLLTAVALVAGLAAASSAAAAEGAALRKGRIVPGADGVVTPRAWVPGIGRRGGAPRPPCDAQWPLDPRSAFERARGGRPVPLSSYEDDPFAGDAIVECLGVSQFTRIEPGTLELSNARVRIEDEPIVYRQDRSTGEFVPFANNPWPQPVSNAERTFLFPDEPRFPRHEIERDAAGVPVLRDGLQVWQPRDLHRGMNAAFDAALAARGAAEHWSGRTLRWGENDRLNLNSHAFVDFNAFFSPTARMLFFGVVPYRLPGESGIESIKMFELASSWEIAAHEAGHALHAELKPNRDPGNAGYHSWSESFGDQIAMWAALRDPSRVASLVAQAVDFSQSNALSALGEAFAALVGEGTGLRDAVNDRKVSTTSPEVHDRSEVLTGAAYTVFLEVLRRLDRRDGAARALATAGDIMGILLVRAADYTPENTMTLEDVARGMLKADKELLGGQYRRVLVDEFLRREIFDAGSLAQWLAHEAAVPRLRLRGTAEREIDALVQAHLEVLGIGPAFGLALQSVTREQRFGQTLVRVQLTLGRGSAAEALGNHGILVFRENGTLADWHGPLPAGEAPAAQQQQARALLEWARQLGLDRHGAPLALVRKPDGDLTVEARVLRGGAMTPHAEVFSLEKREGERREVVLPIAPR